MKYILIVLFYLLACPKSMANVKPNSLFSDHLVLQKGVSVPVWGTADEGETVRVQFAGQTKTTIAKNGRWMTKLDPMPYVTTATSMIISGKNTITIEDVVVGEVWLCSGQSNMERQLGPRPPQPLLTDWEKERDAANYPQIREFYVPLKYSATEVEDVNSKWTVCSPQAVADFSAVAYFFAKNLYAHLQVPIGIVFSAYGGTPAEDWTSKAALIANPDLPELVKDYDQIMNSNWHPDGQVMSGLYNGMIHPLIPLAIKGVAWYQGESNNARAEQYQTVLANMIHNWRQDFKQGDLPFLIVQIAPHPEMKPELREAQLQVSQSVKNTALIVTTDCGDANIHPPHKQPVGERLALAARRLAYGEKNEYSGPVYRSHKIKGDKVILRFSHVGEGLTTNDGSTLKGFTIAGSYQQFVPATAVIKGAKVIVYSQKIQDPVAVRYGWENSPDVNLFNQAGLPASPFRTDRDDLNN